ncbi:MAG: hypothetical protein ACOZF2_19345 [Thermodesulfobacteriota bacterium]
MPSLPISPGALLPILICPRLADVIATGLNDDDALTLAAKVLDWFKDTGKKKRLGKIIDEIGLTPFQKELGLPVE